MPKWHPASVGYGAPTINAPPAPTPPTFNPWTNPSHPAARASMGLAAAAPPTPAAPPAAAANNPWTNPSHPTARAAMGLATAAAPDVAPHVGHHGRWYPAPVTAAAIEPMQYVQWPVAAAPRNLWKPSTKHLHDGIYSWGFPSFIACAQPAPIYQPGGGGGGGGGNVQYYATGPQSPGPTHFTTQDGRRMQLVPEIPTPDSRYYCRELDGSYVDRSHNDIMHNCQPGEWRAHPETQFPYWYRLKA